MWPHYYDMEPVMRRYLVIALLACTFSAHALESLRIGNQLLVVGDSAARVKAMLGNPSVHAKGGSAKKTSSKTSGQRKGKSGKSDKGERWQYQRDGHTVTITIVGGKVSHIDDVAR
jgi:hypothetical protein